MNGLCYIALLSYGLEMKPERRNNLNYVSCCGHRNTAPGSVGEIGTQLAAIAAANLQVTNTCEYPRYFSRGCVTFLNDCTNHNIASLQDSNMAVSSRENGDDYDHILDYLAVAGLGAFCFDSCGVPRKKVSQDGAPPHFHNAVRAYLNTEMSDRWIGRAGDRVFVPPLPRDLEELKTRIREAAGTVTEDMLKRVWEEFDYRLDICRVTRGSHIESLTGDRREICCRGYRLRLYLDILSSRRRQGNLVGTDWNAARLSNNYIREGNNSNNDVGLSHTCLQQKCTTTLHVTD
ncbi:hypothetical protein ANN_09284 [Periplaneta americana]|uniref:Uncharacterized protein n=1 Tax=Periplaneta americana TaxID=6978 RepID=A0ABQ8TL06_PERAM|nr:hypothetical protein ANN_09284 [Periplaneta americana]